jgi:hypothetical protein
VGTVRLAAWAQTAAGGGLDKAEAGDRRVGCEHAGQSVVADGGVDEVGAGRRGRLDRTSRDDDRSTGA